MSGRILYSTPLDFSEAISVLTAIQTFGYIYGIILRVIDKSLTVEEAIELIREVLAR